ncbi:peptidoglycan-binding domain-containing protein [Streptomyces sennicomposti]|uniref:peptidoglycan-binding domain-containing protein n=1 Tax=Streptomyces sennicomposti TaxID=2873384 RepID=UPI001CA6B186|nr:peptidoglycan-binding domain-containing protein [Streptomyces sennicomposti]MBY8867650.1 peptidoglycan-binding protein [Streptomyces sennicomposti]
MSLWTSLEPASATVDPGSSTRVRLRLRNTGDVVDEYRFEPVGDIAPWTTVEPQTLRLYPGTTGTVELTFAPPRTPDATAGPNPYAVRITPTEHPEAVTVPEGNLTITPFTEVRAELVPPTVKGRFRGRPRLAVDNLGNTKVTASVSGSDNGDQLSYDLHPSNVQIEPGRAAFVKATLKPRKIIWFGAKEQRPYTLSVQRSGANPLPVEGTYLQRGFLPRWLATFLGVGLALSLAFVMFWIAYKPNVSSAATEKLAEAAATALPTAMPSVGALPAGGASRGGGGDATGGDDDGAGLAPPAGGDGDGQAEGDTASGGSEAKGGGGGAPAEAKKDAPRGPLPFRPGDGPNLFVQFAQVRLATFPADSPCRLTDHHTVGMMDTATVEALKCWQRQVDGIYDGVMVKTDGLGNLGRSTMTALLMAHLGKNTADIQPGEDNPNVVWFNSVLLWATYDRITDNVVTTQSLFIRSNMQYLQGVKPRAHAPVNDALKERVKLYQRAMGLPVTGTVDDATYRQLHGGRIVSQDQPGEVTAGDYPPLPATDQ